MLVAGRLFFLSLLVQLVGGAAAAAAEDFETGSHRFEEVADGVYFVSEAGALYLMSNALVVVNEEDVLVVDSHVSPAAGRALLEGIAELTDKPVRTLVNTHFHFDHAHGNQAFGADVEIIGHEFTRRMLAPDAEGAVPALQHRTYAGFEESLEPRLERMRASSAERTGDEATEHQRQIDLLADFITSNAELAPRPPDVTVADRLTLHRGSREIQVHYLGRGHTGGDVVVLLPEEGILFTGDLLLPGLSFMGDGHVDEWSATLARLAELDFELIVPGHGRPFSDRSKIGQLQDYYGDLWQAVVAERAGGATAQEAAIKIDLTRHQGLGIEERGANVRAVARIYELLEEREP